LAWSYIVNLGYRYCFLSAIKLSGIYIGFSERDYGISIGDTITIYGKAFYD